MNAITLRRNAVLAAMAASLALTAFTSAFAADQPTAPMHIRGTVLAVTDAGFTVQTPTGTQTIAVAPATKITGVVPSSLDAIKSGTFIGTANVPGASGARALEVVVFPDAMKGTGLGDYAWDLPAKSGTPSAMTNGTVKQSKSGGTKSAMTNGTVKTSSGSGARTLVVDYGKGEKTINVPANVPVVTFQAADRTAIVKGAHVFVVGKPGNPVGAGLVAVGLNGTVPPM
ncbi:hypothetical protein [Rhodanobacter sp. BL-MT-08]